MTALVVPVVAALLGAALLLAFWRVLRGPTWPDRILALDTLYIDALALLVLLGIHFDATLYFEAALLIAMLGFVGTVVLSKFILRGDIIE